MARIETCVNQECGKKFMVSNLQQSEDIPLNQPACPFCRTAMTSCDESSTDGKMKQWALAEDESVS